jgi:hypothetical protein
MGCLRKPGSLRGTAFAVIANSRAGRAGRVGLADGDLVPAFGAAEIRTHDDNSSSPTL